MKTAISTASSSLAIAGYLNELGEYISVPRYHELSDFDRSAENPLGYCIPVYKEVPPSASSRETPALTKNGKPFDLDHFNWEQIKAAAAQSPWVPRNALSSYWVDALCEVLKSSPDDDAQQEAMYQEALSEALPPMSFASTLRWFFNKGWTAFRMTSRGQQAVTKRTT